MIITIAPVLLNYIPVTKQYLNHLLVIHQALTSIKAYAIQFAVLLCSLSIETDRYLTSSFYSPECLKHTLPSVYSLRLNAV